MDARQVENEIIGKIKNFEKSINIPAGYDASILERILAQNPRLLFYIRDLQIRKGISSFFQVETRVQIQYHNHDFDINDVHVVSTISDILSLLCRYIGNYKTKLALIADSQLDIGATFTKFKEKYSVFYPNFTQARFTGYIVGKRSIYEFEFTYRIGRVKLNMMETEIQTEVDRISKLLFHPPMPPEAKIYLAHNYLASSITYYGTGDVSNLEKSYVHSAYGALITKKCVCQGVAEAFKRLMDKAGVECEIVCGQIIGHDDYHAWNIVKLSDTECFHVDVTWDISAKTLSYLYFGKNDAFLEKTRRWNKAYNTKCQPKHNLFMMARKYIIANKQTLLRQGISLKILGV